MEKWQLASWWNVQQECKEERLAAGLWCGGSESGENELGSVTATSSPQMLDGLVSAENRVCKISNPRLAQLFGRRSIKRNHGKMAFGYNSTLVASGKVAKRILEKALLSRMQREGTLEGNGLVCILK
jgi:hypothetical protein